VNSTVNQILEDALGVGARRRALDRYATWTQRDLAEVTEAVAAQRTIDDAVWR
jgi:hypothetical protein